MRERDDVWAEAVNVYDTSQYDRDTGNWTPMTARMNYLILETLLDIRDLLSKGEIK